MLMAKLFKLEKNSFFKSKHEYFFLNQSGFTIKFIKLIFSNENDFTAYELHIEQQIGRLLRRVKAQIGVAR